MIDVLATVDGYDDKHAMVLQAAPIFFRCL